MMYGTLQTKITAKTKKSPYAYQFLSSTVDGMRLMLYGQGNNKFAPLYLKDKPLIIDYDFSTNITNLGSMQHPKNYRVVDMNSSEIEKVIKTNC